MPEKQMLCVRHKKSGSVQDRPEDAAVGDRRQRRNELRRKRVKSVFTIGLEVERRIVLVAGMVEGETVETGRRRGRRPEFAMRVGSKGISGKIVECLGRMGSTENEIFNLYF